MINAICYTKANPRSSFSIEPIGHVTLVAIRRTFISAPYLEVNSLQPIWRSGLHTWMESTGARSSSELPRLDCILCRVLEDDCPGDCRMTCSNTTRLCGMYMASLWPSDAIWRHRSGSTLAQVMACCLMATSHYLNQCWLVINGVYDIHLRTIPHFQDINPQIEFEKSAFMISLMVLWVNTRHLSHLVPVVYLIMLILLLRHIMI